jgi:hypothetical protein
MIHTWNLKKLTAAANIRFGIYNVRRALLISQGSHLEERDATKRGHGHLPHLIFFLNNQRTSSRSRP